MGDRSETRTGELQKALEDFGRKLLASQKDLPPECAKVLEEHFWELLSEEVAATTASSPDEELQRAESLGAFSRPLSEGIVGLEVEELVHALTLARPIIAASAEASHLLQGFTRSETAGDRLLQTVDAALAHAGSRGAATREDAGADADAALVLNTPSTNRSETRAGDDGPIRRFGNERAIALMTDEQFIADLRWWAEQASGTPWHDGLRLLLNEAADRLAGSAPPSAAKLADVIARAFDLGVACASDPELNKPASVQPCGCVYLGGGVWDCEAHAPEVIEKADQVAQAIPPGET